MFIHRIRHLYLVSKLRLLISAHVFRDTQTSCQIAEKIRMTPALLLLVLQPALEETVLFSICVKHRQLSLVWEQALPLAYSERSDVGAAFCYRRRDFYVQSSCICCLRNENFLSYFRILDRAVNDEL